MRDIRDNVLSRLCDAIEDISGVECAMADDLSTKVIVVARQPRRAIQIDLTELMQALGALENA